MPPVNIHFIIATKDGCSQDVVDFIIRKLTRLIAMAVSPRADVVLVIH
jgi:hypothetical protein